MRGISASVIHEILGSTRQGMSQYYDREEVRKTCLALVEQRLVQHRKIHPGLGLVKAYSLLEVSCVGRDRFVAIMTRRGYALALKKNYTRTTHSGSYRYPNLIKLLIINYINLIWQSDTTYFRIGEYFYYLTFIIDVYSRRIVGYSVSNSLRAQANVEALKQALRTRKGQDFSQLILHSDGGTQYRYRPFVELLRSHGISSSMCAAATDNAYAEKLNDVIKNEYLTYFNPKDMQQLKRLVKRSVDNYNEVRPHGQLPAKRSPINFETYLCEQAISEHPLLLIRDGQAQRNLWQPTRTAKMNKIGLWAPQETNQIMPTNIILHQPMIDPQLVLDLENY